ncbi:MAG: DNA repair protein RadC [Candidatus Fermentibacteraceae bacterium]|nr:DNA repair protein RadC [Candidatus Fermentibacteraceae bacterium]
MSLSTQGHRERLRQRFLEAGIKGFSDRDALELLLTYAIPRKDTKETAAALIEKFGSLRNVLNQPPSMLQTVHGIGPAASILLNLATSITTQSFRLRKGTQVIDSPEKVREYLEIKMSTLRKERLIALLLDSSNRLITECILEFGTVDKAAVHPRNLLEKVIATGATGVILVHNHPGGANRASQEDIRLTRNLRDLGKSLGFRLLDHMIVADGETLSLREEGVFD